MKLNIAVCDDEAIALKINCTYIEELAKKYRVEANIIGFSSGKAVMEFLDNNVIDIAFLDIDLKGISGIQVASALLKKNPKVITIFITGHREFAYDAFMVEAFSFLMKPVDPERMERIFKKAIIQINYISNRKTHAPLIITEDNIKKKLNQGLINFIIREDTQSVIVTKNARHYVYETITSLNGRLEANFLRINQSVIVNLAEVASMEHNQMLMKSGEIFTIGRTYHKEVKKRYLEYPQG